MATKASHATPLTYTHLALQKRRMDRGLSLESIADSTKISMRFLKAIEEEDFEQLPGGIFDRSYLRQYAAAIGFDESKLLAHYTRQMEPDRNSEMVLEPESRGLRRWFRIQAAPGR